MKKRAKGAGRKTRKRKEALPLHAVILAGGAGERFWPASRKHSPKPLMKVVGGKSLLAATVERAHKFAGEGCVWIVCGKEHAGAIRKESGLPVNRVLVEPRRRNTAMAVAWAAQRIEAEEKGAVLAILSADHHIPNGRAFAAAIRRCGHSAASAGALVTLGVEPTRPDTGYGYIQRGNEAGPEHPGLYRVRRFVEKPDTRRALGYLASGDYLWNAGVFVFEASTLLNEVAECAPELHRALAPLRKQPRGRNSSAVDAAYRRAPSVPIDVAVMERSRKVWTMPVDFAWSDVGTWSSLADELGVGQAGRDGNRVLAGEVLLEDSSSNLVWGGDRLIGLLGVEGLAIIDTEDALLVARLDKSHELRKLVSGLGKKGRQDLT